MCYIKLRSCAQLLAFNHEPNEIAQFSQPALYRRNLLIEPKTPSEIPSVGIVVETLDKGSILIESFRAVRISLADEFVPLTPQGSGHLIQIEFWMVLHAPEHSWAMTDLHCLNLGYRVEGQSCASFGQRLNLVRVESWGVE
jgi:hypothetical protein